MTNQLKLIEIHRASRVSLMDILNGISPESFSWKPAPDSRSIGEIMHHLLRVDIWFLKRLGVSPDIEVKKDADADEIKILFEKLWVQIESLLTSYSDDEFFKEVPVTDKIPYKSPATVFAHIPQHYLYHISQMVYLRRAQDRNWKAPLGSWEHATDVIAENILSK